MMKFYEYKELVKDVEVSDELKYAQAVLWLHPSELPIGLVSLGNCDSKVIKVPVKAKNRFGKIVSVISVSQNAFSHNENVTDIILPSTIGSIGTGAFSGCKNLKNITIPKRIRFIGEKTFEGCTNLENVYYEGTREDWKKIKIIHEKPDVELGALIPGTPVQSIVSDIMVNIPGNEALFSANIHFRCYLEGMDLNPTFKVRVANKDVSSLLRTL